jgi:hypothetical protein
MRSVTSSKKDLKSTIKRSILETGGQNMKNPAHTNQVEAYTSLTAEDLGIALVNAQLSSYQSLSWDSYEGFSALSDREIDLSTSCLTAGHMFRCPA